MKNKPENRNLQITRRAVCILAVCVIVVILGTAGLCLYFVYNKKPVWTQADLTVTQEVLHNPYCGWYQIYGYTLTDESQTAGQNPAWSVLDTKISAAVAQSESANDRLALLQINLKQFADRDLTENALAELKHILTRWGRKLLQPDSAFFYMTGTAMRKALSQTTFHRLKNICGSAHKY
ncbi:MAG: DUF4874 domain-containing protein [Lachnospira sp.]